MDDNTRKVSTINEHIKVVDHMLDLFAEHLESENKTVEGTLTKLVVAITASHKQQQESEYTPRNDSET